MAMEEVPLPKTDELLDMIREGSLQHGGGATVPIGAFNDAMTVLRRELNRHLGPFGGMIWDEYIEDHGEPRDQRQYSAMIQAFAAEIDDPVKRGDFRRKAKELV